MFSPFLPQADAALARGAVFEVTYSQAIQSEREIVRMCVRVRSRAWPMLSAFSMDRNCLKRPVSTMRGDEWQHWCTFFAGQPRHRAFLWAQPPALILRAEAASLSFGLCLELSFCSGRACTFYEAEVRRRRVGENQLSRPMPDFPLFVLILRRPVAGNRRRGCTPHPSNRRGKNIHVGRSLPVEAREGGVSRVVAL